MNRLTDPLTKALPWSKNPYGALEDFEKALKYVGAVKEFIYEQNLIIGTVRYGLQNTKIEIEAQAID